jgi:hypothetical protein
LGNVGKLISPDDIFIFKKYDILEGGVDWLFLNKSERDVDDEASYISLYRII